MMETLDIDKDGNLVMEDFIRMRFLKDDKTKSQQTFQKIFRKKNDISHLLIFQQRIFLDQDDQDKTSSSTATARCVIF